MPVFLGQQKARVSRTSGSAPAGNQASRDPRLAACMGSAASAMAIQPTVSMTVWPAPLPDRSRCTARSLRLHRGLLQHPPHPIGARLPVARELQGNPPNAYLELTSRVNSSPFHCQHHPVNRRFPHRRLRPTEPEPAVGRRVLWGVPPQIPLHPVDPSCPGCILIVPSVVARTERNIIINASHPEFPGLQPGPETPVWWDERLFG